MLEIVGKVLLYGVGLIALRMIAVALPQSRLRDFAMAIVACCYVLFWGVYVLSLVDLLTGVLIVGGCAALTAIEDRKAH